MIASPFWRTLWRLGYVLLTFIINIQFQPAAARQCARRTCLYKDIAAMALYLAADESAMCTGQNYSVDGGVENCFDKQYGR